MIKRLLILFACCLAAASAGATEVRLRSAVNCSATVVRLGDLAEIASDDPAVAGDLASLALFPAPPAGGSRQLDRHQVRQLLVFSGIDMTKVTITGSELVVVQTTGKATSRPIRGAGSATSAVRLASLETPIARPRQKAAPEEPVAPLIKRGESVTVHSRAAGVRITTSGKALSDGALGAEISVEMEDRKTKIVGRVAGPQTIELNVSRP
jgi:hypothetical protein